LCTPNRRVTINNILKHSTYRVKHWETKGYNHPHRCRGNQDNKSHTMDGNTTRISQIPLSNNSKPLLYHHSLTTPRSNGIQSTCSRPKAPPHNYHSSTSSLYRIWGPHSVMGRVWNINT